MTRGLRAAGAVAGVTAAAGLAAFAYGALVERVQWTVREEVLPILGPGARPITVLHLSDVHMAPWQDGKQDFIRSLAVYEPDLVIDTGDAYGHPDALEALRWAYEPFRGTPGVFVHGSNDYYGPRFKNPLRYLGAPSTRAEKPIRLDIDGLGHLFGEELGWLDLNNRARAIELRGTRIELFGTNDAHREWDRLDLLPGAVDEMRENVEWSAGTGEKVLSLGVTHAPYRRVLDAFVTHGAELIFAGHTHGGQVRVPGVPALVTNCDIPPAQAQGLSVWQHGRASAFLEVSAGIGTSIYAPVRFATPPEAVVVTLTPVDIGYS
ncbi:MAG: metallophosphoesterase [Micrococcales bacterium]|nr:metallophosphoesterase [Micrococcales bacterium]